MTSNIHLIPSKEPEPQKSSEPAAAPVIGRDPARELRRQRARRLGLRLAFCVALPTAVAGVYYGAIATDQFDSTALFTIQAADAPSRLSLETLIVPGMASSPYGLIAREYILSREMLDQLDKKHGLIRHYQSAQVDWWSRLPGDATREDAYEYYQEKIRVAYDTTSGSLTLEVRAYSAEKAQALARAILKNSQELVNRTAEHARQDQTRFARDEVATAEKRLIKAREALAVLQQERSELDPEQTATAALTIRSGLESEVAKARADLMQLRSYMQPEAPQVLEAQARVNSLSAQVAHESRRMVNPKGEKGLNTSIAQFEVAILEKQFAEEAYQAARTALELARAEATRQHRYLATIAPPSIPDESTHPVRWLAVLTVAIVSFLLFGILSLVVGAIKEHSRL
jgi:capsular polysaccharide transport system permease protein